MNPYSINQDKAKDLVANDPIIMGEGTSCIKNTNLHGLLVLMYFLINGQTCMFTKGTNVPLSPSNIIKT